MRIVCLACSNSADPELLPRHMHYTLVEGFVYTTFWSDGTKTAKNEFGYKIEGALF